MAMLFTVIPSLIESRNMNSFNDEGMSSSPEVNTNSVKRKRKSFAENLHYEQLAALAGLPMQQNTLCKCLKIGKPRLQQMVAAGCPVIATLFEDRKFYDPVAVKQWMLNFDGVLPNMKPPKQPRRKTS
ncbi:hypothetical protein SH668x_001775 [Planctomicrobium sp. SH668]|uniref:hypothetical protein n=1 Tax=Planctomicrobium sp. SH668 TaxID=3448126 RepID=UPI003F5C9512